MQNLFNLLRLITITTLFSIALISCNSDDRNDNGIPPKPTTPLSEGCYWKWDADDHHWETECDNRNRSGNGRYTNPNQRPDEVLPSGCHWEWDRDDNRWERDCDDDRYGRGERPGKPTSPSPLCDYIWDNDDNEWELKCRDNGTGRPPFDPGNCHWDREDDGYYQWELECDND
ncbi:hypothetical protein EI427_00715 [Flammeovirga pectinis]|uniref:Uncharacterized protein n=1 Tax=Flammeovirga pectinis TaxID=2494373 RepID=A0A3Q9FIZ2_9BACT|nr:hypothetical protein [Flammeovirga pectinis]AZQ60782.1 hypothetical protein EI427_00715 [Flammeovirga pectinis]